MATKTKRDIYQEVTGKMIEALEQGIVPWRRPWTALDQIHKNFKSKKPYRGINIFILDVTAAIEGYKQPWWLTFKQAKSLGGNVREGERSTLVTFWKVSEYKDDKDLDENGDPRKKKAILLRYYNVFNVEQCEGIELPELNERETNPIEQADQVIKGMPKRPKIIHKGGRAAYSPFFDYVTVPEQSSFYTDDGYYGVLFHELVHSTGHESRLGRVKDWTSFGEDSYCQEELVAEMGGAMLSSVSGVQANFKNSAAYIRGFLKRLEGDKYFVIQAASKAQKAADFIQGTTFEECK